jgi:hypothetical protein
LQTKDLLALLGPLVAALVALVWWRVQALGKRRMEVAEEALVAFMSARAALEAMHEGFLTDADRDFLESKRFAVHPETGEERGEMTRVILGRSIRIRQELQSSRKTQLLCRYHFGERAAASFDALKEAISPMIGVAHDRAGLHRFEGEKDVLAKLDDAQSALEESVAPTLKADSLLVPGLWRTGHPAARSGRVRPR